MLLNEWPLWHLLTVHKLCYGRMQTHRKWKKLKNPKSNQINGPRKRFCIPAQTPKCTECMEVEIILIAICWRWCWSRNHEKCGKPHFVHEIDICNHHWLSNGIGRCFKVICERHRQYLSFLTSIAADWLKTIGFSRTRWACFPIFLRCEQGLTKWIVLRDLCKNWKVVVKGHSCSS